LWSECGVLDLGLRNFVSGHVQNFPLKMAIMSPLVAILLLVMLWKFSLNYGQDEDQVRIIQISSVPMRLA
jgi:hypothetical protein